MSHHDSEARRREHLHDGVLLGHVSVELSVAAVPLDGVEQVCLDVVLALEGGRGSALYGRWQRDANIPQTVTETCKQTN